MADVHGFGSKNPNQVNLELGLTGKSPLHCICGFDLGGFIGIGICSRSSQRHMGERESRCWSKTHAPTIAPTLPAPGTPRRPLCG